MNLDPLTRQSRDVVRELIADGLAKALAAALHRSLKQIYRWAEHWDELCVNPLERVARMIQLDKKRRIITWLCAQAGGTFQPNPEPAAVAAAPLPVATVQLFGQIGQFESTVAAAEAAGPVTITQARQVREQWNGLERAAKHFVLRLEHTAKRVGLLLLPWLTEVEGFSW